ncbi:hypothetical protein BaRGS_00019457 [Batillaria attramentaria]|uniref:Uncharacterized protein n=1 Tax=Batillaria attramentaria TaxID=370345 RepID=A0ABD0KQC2_9CAEN
MFVNSEGVGNPTGYSLTQVPNIMVLSNTTHDGVHINCLINCNTGGENKLDWFSLHHKVRVVVFTDMQVSWGVRGHENCMRRCPNGTKKGHNLTCTIVQLAPDC